MMEALFLRLLNMSIQATVLITVVVFVRVLLRKAPKWIQCLLWLLVAVRLMCPFSIESAFSLAPNHEVVNVDVYDKRAAVRFGYEVFDRPIDAYLENQYHDTGHAALEEGSANILTGISFVWVLGMIAMAFYAIGSCLRITMRVKQSVHKEDNIYICDDIDTPFILGIIRPCIYLPSGLDTVQTESVIAHEKSHLKRMDHVWKPLGYVLLVIYWFNPFCWLAYILLCRDIEMACDERVIKEMDMEQKKVYSRVLLSFSMPGRLISACPLAFGEVGVKQRIKSVLNYKKTAFWIIFSSIIVIAVVSICFLTNPKKDKSLKETDGKEVIEKTEPEGGIRQQQAQEEAELEEAKQKAEETLQMKAEQETEARLQAQEEEARLQAINEEKQRIEANLQENVAKLKAVNETKLKIQNAHQQTQTARLQELEEEQRQIEAAVADLEAEKQQLETAVAQQGAKLVAIQTAQNEAKLQEKNLQPVKAFIDSWAKAYCDQDGRMIYESSNAAVRDKLEVEKEDGVYLFGLSSPWPWTDSAYYIASLDDKSACIYYYAQTSDPHVTVWRQNLSFTKKEASDTFSAGVQADTDAENGYLVKFVQMEILENIVLGSEFDKAYGRGINGTWMDYSTNELGEALNRNALLSSSDYYRGLFEPESAARILLNLLSNQTKVQISVTSKTEEECILKILFLEDHAERFVKMVQPWGKDGIWIVRDLEE